MFEDEIHLFIFRRQGVALRFAAADRDVVIGEHTYVAATIERDAIRESAESAKDKLKIRMAYSVAVATPPNGWEPTQAVGDWWRPHIPFDPITVTCLSYDPGGGDPPRPEWTGWALQPVFDDAQLELTCSPNPPHGGFANQGPKWGRQCFKTVYSTGARGCNLDPVDFEIPTDVWSKSGLVIQSDDFIGTPFPLTSGWVSWTATSGFIEVRPIMAHNNSTGQITILSDSAPPEPESTIVATPNCPGTWAACAARREDPQNHYGGAVYKPVRDPIAEGIPMSWG